MTKKRTLPHSNEGIIAEQVSGQAIAVGNNAQANVYQQQNQPADEIATAFAQLLETVNRLPAGPKKASAQIAVEALKEEARKGDQAEEGAVTDWFATLAQMAPDAFEVACSTFINPIKGLALIFQKIAKKAKSKSK